MSREDREDCRQCHSGGSEHPADRLCALSARGRPRDPGGARHRRPVPRAQRCRGRADRARRVGQVVQARLPRRWTPTHTCGPIPKIKPAQPSTACSAPPVPRACPEWGLRSITAGERLERTSWPVSRILFPGALRRSRSAAIHLGLPLPAGSSGLPAGIGRAALERLRRHRERRPLGLAPGGVYRAAPVTRGAGGLLHHRFTLTPAHAGAVCFLWHCPAGHPGLPLATTLPCGVRTFLVRRRVRGTPPHCRGRPANSSATTE